MFTLGIFLPGQGFGAGSKQLSSARNLPGMVPREEHPTMPCTRKVLLLCTPSLLGGSDLVIHSGQEQALDRTLRLWVYVKWEALDG